MPTNGSLADTLRECRGYVVTLETRAAELPPHLQDDRIKLAAAIAKTEDAGIRQSQYTALVQQATRDQDAGRIECRNIATRIRNSLRGFYGLTDEMLNLFGLRPRRFTRTVQTKPPEVEVSPPQAATPAADGTT